MTICASSVKWRMLIPTSSIAVRGEAISICLYHYFPDATPDFLHGTAGAKWNKNGRNWIPGRKHLNDRFLDSDAPLNRGYSVVQIFLLLLTQLDCLVDLICFRSGSKSRSRSRSLDRSKSKSKSRSRWPRKSRSKSRYVHIKLVDHYLFPDATPDFLLWKCGCQILWRWEKWNSW